MPTYLEIQNNNSRVIINDEYKNMSLAEKMENPAKKLDLTKYFNEYYLQYKASNDSLAFCGFTAKDREIPFSTDGVFWTHDDGTVPTYFFSYQPGGSSKSGMQTFDESGKCVFDSNLQYLKIVDHIFLQKADLQKGTIQKQYSVPVGVCILSNYRFAFFCFLDKKSGYSEWMETIWDTDRSFHIITDYSENDPIPVRDYLDCCVYQALVCDISGLT